MNENPKQYMTDAEIAAEDDCAVVRYDPKRCWNGYTVFSFEAGPPQSRLIDMNGRVLNTWRQRCERAKLLPGGNLLMVGETRRQVLELDWHGRLVWEFLAPGSVHHDATRLANGNTVFLYRERVPEEVRQRSADAERRNVPLASDAIMEVTPDGQVMTDWHQYAHFDIDWYKPADRLKADWTHTNTINCLPPNRWYDAGDDRFKPGNYLISMRSLDAIMIVDRESGRIAWKYTGDYRDGLSGQHEPNMIPPDRPGAGNILIFDNGVEQAHHGQSIVLEVEPPTGKVVWTYEPDDFYSGYRSTVERMPNGNTIINEADHKRMLEVTADGQIVWEYRLTPRWRAGRCHRVPYDWVPAAAGLPEPDPTPVEGDPPPRPKPYYAQAGGSPTIPD